jgi:hypothetical protein
VASAKLIALCVCPVVAAPPAIMLASPPARHHVARALHKVANHIEPQREEPAPCGPEVASAPLPAALGAVAPSPEFASDPQPVTAATSAMSTPVWNDGPYEYLPYSHLPAGDGGIPAPAPATPAVAEPASWALMIAGFGVLGTVLRANGAKHRRLQGATKSGTVTASL